MYLFSELSPLPLFLLLTLWAWGGYLLLRPLALPAHERGLAGLGLGLTVASLLANLLGRFLPVSLAFWLSAALTLGLGILFSLPLRPSWGKTPLRMPWQWAGFAALALLLTLVGRGLGIFDDYQNLPQISSMALGDLPPHFVYDPRLLWSYHYFLLLTAAQFTRLANAPVWTALDLARGLTLALTLFYAGFLALRLTQNRLLAFASAGFLFFVGGARWILLLLPASLLSRISASVQMIGSGADTAPSLALALTKYWKIQGLPPLPFPFVYGSGLDPSLTLAQAGYGASMFMLVLLAILTAQGKEGWRKQAILAILLAALALANEVTFAFLYAGLGAALAAWMFSRRRLALPASLLGSLPAWLGGAALALVQGGVLTGVLMGLTAEKTGADALYKVSFLLRLPTVLSAHVGALSLLNPWHWLVILAETGLVIFSLPWALRHAWRLANREEWLEAAWGFSILPSLATIFMEYTGNAGPTALSRMTAHFLVILKIYALPLLWLWAKEKSEGAKMTLAGWAFAAAFSGVSLFGLQLSGLPNPVYAEFLSVADAKMYARHWGTLQPGAWVFDPNPTRATTVLGLHSLSGQNYGPPTYPEWLALAEDPSPAALHAAGFRYAYLDAPYWRKYADHFTIDCVVVLDDLQENQAERRLLLDLSACPAE